MYDFLIKYRPDVLQNSFLLLDFYALKRYTLKKVIRYHVFQEEVK